MSSPAAPVSTNSAQATVPSTLSTPSVQPTVSSTTSKVPVPAPLPTKAQWEIELATAEARLKAAIEGRAGAETIAKAYGSIALIHVERKPKVSSALYAAAEASRQAVLAFCSDPANDHQYNFGVFDAWKLCRSQALRSDSGSTAGSTGDPYKELTKEGVQFWENLRELEGRFGVSLGSVIKLERFQARGVEAIACGEIHLDMLDDQAVPIDKTLGGLAANGQCVAGFEGYINDKSLKKRLKDHEITPKEGFQYGLEDAQTIMAVDSTLTLVYLVDVIGREAARRAQVFGKLRSTIACKILRTAAGINIWNKLTIQGREQRPQPKYWPQIREIADLESRKVPVGDDEYIRAFMINGKINDGVVRVWVDLLATLGEIAWQTAHEAGRASANAIKEYAKLKHVCLAGKKLSDKQMKSCREIAFDLALKERNPHFSRQGVNIIHQMNKDGIKGIPLILTMGFMHLDGTVQGMKRALADDVDGGPAGGTAPGDSKDRKENEVSPA